MRIPFVGAPLTADEGGYGEVARLWESGWRLYDEVWVDRPQGLVLAFRSALALGGAPSTLRWLAIAVAMATVLALFQLGLIVGGRIVGIAAALLLATAGASPWIESFTLAGELLAALPATAAVLAFAIYLRSQQAEALVAAGLLAGCALMVKQSAVDALVAIVVTLIVTERRGGLRPATTATVCAALPLLAGILVSRDPESWWHAVVSYRSQGDSLLTGSVSDRLGQLSDSVPAASAALGLTLVLVAVGWGRAPLLARAWFAGALAGVLGGGNFHTHYFIQLAAPAALLGGFGLGRIYAWRPRGAMACAAVVGIVALATTLPLALAGRSAQAGAIWPHDPHLTSDAAVASWVRAQTTPSETIQVLWGAASIYYLSGRAPATPIMWKRPLETVPGALRTLRASLALREPALVVLAQSPTAGDPTGAVARILQRNYRDAATVQGIRILQVKDSRGRG